MLTLASQREQVKSRWDNVVKGSNHPEIVEECEISPKIHPTSVILKNKMIFHKRRIIKVTHASGEVDYNVEINGFLGLPFLWQIDQEDMGLYIDNKRGMTLEAAIEYVKEKDREYCKKKSYKVIKYEQV